MEDIYGDFSPSGRILIAGDTSDAVEAATFLCRSHRVTLAVNDKLLPQLNRQLAKFAERQLTTQLTIQTQPIEDQSQFDLKVLASQRAVNIGSLHLDTAEVTYSDEVITTNGSCQTSNPKIYPVGECSGCQSSEALAIHQGMVAAEHACGLEGVLDATFILQLFG